MNVAGALEQHGSRLALEAKGVSRRYRRQAALDGVNVTIERGELVAVMGPSGCGKTTLLNILGGLDRPDTGTVTVEGEPISYRDRDLTRLHRAQVGFVFQGHGLIPFLTVAENVEFTMLVNGVSVGTRRARSRALLEAVGLEDRADRFPEELSGGQRQRVAVARSLAHRPAVVLADEPTGNLDHQTSVRVIGVLVRACRESEAALVVVTHDPEIAAHMERVIHMKDGRILVANDTGLASRLRHSAAPRSASTCEVSR